MVAGSYITGGMPPTQRVLALLELPPARWALALFELPPARWALALLELPPARWALALFERHASPMVFILNPARRCSLTKML
jgi:hypothetical protein